MKIPFLSGSGRRVDSRPELVRKANPLFPFGNQETVTVGVGGLGITDGVPIASAGFRKCQGAIFELPDRRFALGHWMGDLGLFLDAQRTFNELPLCQVILVSGSISYDRARVISERGHVIQRKIDIPTGNGAWSLFFDPLTNSLHVAQEISQTVFRFPGFAD